MGLFLKNMHVKSIRQYNDNKNLYNACATHAPDSFIHLIYKKITVVQELDTGTIESDSSEYVLSACVVCTCNDRNVL